MSVHWVCPSCPRTWSGPGATRAVEDHWQRTSHAPYVQSIGQTDSALSRCACSCASGAEVVFYLNPDCQQGKHTACSGDAWDHEADLPALCECACHHVTHSALDSVGQTFQSLVRPKP